ncbi:putative ABC-type ATPase [Pedobacter sp. UYP30]|uniref:zeta toxin family protein n=1 Tax=Pedobacter sp. UYP30 TaxID=1756400 RepID=UPI003393964D
MSQPELFVVTGPNAAGKSSFIRSRLNDFSGFEIIMTGVYKDRTREVFTKAIQLKKSIVLETVFNNQSFIDFIAEAKKANYKLSLICLFLNNPQQSLNRVVLRYLEQSGLEISKGNVEINFMENFKNVSNFHFVFDRADFIYTGNKNQNENLMTLKGLEIIAYKENESTFLQLFAKYALSRDKLSKEAFDIIVKNIDFNHGDSL